MSGVRFCPFCKEPFDGELCPDHGLPLVTLVELASVRRTPGETERLAATDTRFGRGTVTLGAMLVLVGFFLPAVVDGTRDGEITTAFEIWQLRADFLGVVPAAMFVMPLLVFARRTRHDLVRARPALAVVSAIALVAILLAGSNVVAYARTLDRIGAESDLDPAIGVAVMALGFATLVRGIVVLGRAPR